MSDPRWQRVSDLVARALELPEAERQDFVDRESKDERIRREVTSLVQAAASGGDRLGRLSEQVRRTASEVLAAEPSLAGRRIGAWRLVERLGRGGMGTVYRAERADGAFRQQAALKLLRSPLLGPEGRERFTAERQILARLNHPGIARILDGGVLEEGVPWFAMELVDGVPITEACHAGQSSLDHCLKLFGKVCDAVDYAHSNLVVHRDLKPGNVLVTPEGEVKLIDFGVAKLLATNTVDNGDAHPVTPAYAAPEQLRGDATTTATDVWALGVLLYELLTGRRPDAGEDAPPESTRRVAGDVHAIVTKALDSDPEQRYRRASELADDLRRHRDRRPVSARPGTLGYRLGCFVRRHRLGVAAAAAIALLSLGLVASVIQSGLRSRAAAERLSVESSRARATADFLLGVFQLADQDEARGDSISAQELLNRAVTRVHDDLEGEPSVRASMLHTLGQAYALLGLYDSADALFSQTLALRHGPAATENEVELAETLGELGRVRLARGEAAKAEELLLEALDRHREATWESTSEEAALLVQVAEARSAREDPAGAERALTHALELRRAAGDEAAVADTLYALGEVAHRQGRLEQGWRQIEKAVEIYRRIGRTDSREYANALLGLVAARRGPQPIDLAEEARALRRRTYGPDHLLAGEALEAAGSAIEEAGRLAVAERRFRQKLEVERERANGSDRHAAALTGLARVLIRQGRVDAALELLEQAVDIGAAVPGSVAHITALDSIGDALLLRGRPEEAEQRYRERLTICEDIVGPDHPLAVRGEVDLARVALARGDFEQARSKLRHALAVYRGILPPDHPHLAEFEVDLAQALAGLGHVGEAQSLLQHAAAVLEEVHGPEDPRVQRADRLLSSCEDRAASAS